MSSHLHFMVSGMAHAMSDVCTARAVSPPDQSPTPACKCSPRRPHRRRWSTRMCLAELGEGVARGARPIAIRVIDATSTEQLAGILIPGGSYIVLHVFVSTAVHKTQMRNVLSSRGLGSAPLASRSGHAAPIPYGTLRLAVASCTTPFTVAPMLYANSRHSTAVYSCRRARLICTVAELTKWCSPKCPRAPPTARCARPAVPLRPCPRPRPACTRSHSSTPMGHTLSTSVYAICLST